MDSNRNAHEQGYNDGFRKGYDRGFDAGFDDGWLAARQHNSFAGTSIIIPTLNQLQYVQECIESIVDHTETPYEIIVIDNGSTDGTVPYLCSLSGHIQVQLNKVNLGFAGAVNQGLRLARGETLLILNNDVVVTEQWLTNLLHCLHSDERIGIVAPVTNYISGEQLIDVPYTNIVEMHQFARKYNQINPQLWVETKRLTGFCMLMRREVFTRLGYWDEGFEIGNCEDDDYSLRLRLIGLKLIIAKDTFIHHYGSVSMKGLNEQFAAVYEKNLRYYALKWETPQVVLEAMTAASEAGDVHAQPNFYPSHVVVKGSGPDVYWLEAGRRFHMVQGEHIAAVRLSDVDIQHWPLAGTITYNEYEDHMRAIQAAQLAGTLQPGVVVSINDALYQYSGSKLHRFVSRWAYEAWFGHSDRQIMQWTEQHKVAEGLPIVAPIIIKADNI